MPSTRLVLSLGEDVEAVYLAPSTMSGGSLPLFDRWLTWKCWTGDDELLEAKRTRYVVLPRGKLPWS